MSGIAFGDVAKMFLLRICFILFVFYLEGSCKTWLSLTEKKNKALKLVAEVRTKKEFSWFIFLSQVQNPCPYTALLMCNFSVIAELLMFERETH